MYNVSVYVYGNTQGIYTNPCNCEAYVDYTQATNYDEVDMEGVNNIHIRREKDGTMKIFQANGYSYDKGLFSQLY